MTLMRLLLTHRQEVCSLEKKPREYEIIRIKNTKQKHFARETKTDRIPDYSTNYEKHIIM